MCDGLDRYGPGTKAPGERQWPESEMPGGSGRAHVCNATDGTDCSVYLQAVDGALIRDGVKHIETPRILF